MIHSIAHEHAGANHDQHLQDHAETLGAVVENDSVGARDNRTQQRGREGAAKSEGHSRINDWDEKQTDRHEVKRTEPRKPVQHFDDVEDQRDVKDKDLCRPKMNRPEWRLKDRG